MKALRNRAGRVKGYGRCGRCGDAWSWKAPHATPYMDGRGCFPLCEDCWQELTPDKRAPYYQAMWDEWQRQFALVPRKYHAEIADNYGPEVYAAIMQAVREGK